MVRTRADNTARKAVAAKAPRKVLGATSSGAASSSAAGMASPSGKYAGGNPICPRPTPDWQKGISSFLLKSPTSGKENEEPMDEDTGACSSAKVECGNSDGRSNSPTPESQGSSNSSSSSKTKKNGLIDSDSEDE